MQHVIRHTILLAAQILWPQDTGDQQDISMESVVAPSICIVQMVDEEQRFTSEGLLACTRCCDTSVASKDFVRWRIASCRTR